MSKVSDPKKNIVVVSGPAGSGKDTLIEFALQNHSFTKILTTTSRTMRENEEEGREYFFLTPEAFEESIKKGEFVEYSQNENGAYYGVQKKHFNEALEAGRKILWKLDWKGMLHAKELFPGIQSICVMASRETLSQRVRAREGDSYTEQYFEERLAYAQEYFNHQEDYDYVIWNENGKLEESTKQFIETLTKITSA